MKKIIRPSVKKVEIFCEGCNSKGGIFFTNWEICNNTPIQQNCNKCNKFTTWRMIKNEDDFA